MSQEQKFQAEETKTSENVSNDSPFTPPSSQPQEIISPVLNPTTPLEVITETVPTEPLPINVPVNTPITTESTLVPVKGNTSVMRCTKCKTFVSAVRPHTEAECEARRTKTLDSKNNSTPGTKRRRKVDKELLKNFKKLEKKSASTSAAASSISKKASALLKKYKKQKKVQVPKQLTSFLEYVTKKF